MDLFMAYILTTGSIILSVILMASFVFIFKRVPVKIYIDSIAGMSFFLFLLFTILYSMGYLFGEIGYGIILLFILLIFSYYIYKIMAKDKKELDRQYKNGEITKEEYDKIRKERAESFPPYYL